MKEPCRIDDEIVWNPWDEEDSPSYKAFYSEEEE